MANGHGRCGRWVTVLNGDGSHVMTPFDGRLAWSTGSGSHCEACGVKSNDLMLGSPCRSTRWVDDDGADGVEEVA